MSPIIATPISAGKSIPRHVASMLVIACLGLPVLSAAAFAADVLTLADAQRRALERSHQLVAQDFSIAASRYMAVAAGQLPDPVLKVGIDNLPVNGRDRFSLSNDFMTMRRIGVMQEITRIDKRRSRGDRYEREAEKKIAEKELAAAAIGRDTALAWLDRYYAEAMAAVVDEQGEQAMLEIQAAEGSYRAGRGNQADVLAARSTLAAFDDRRSELGQRVRNAKTMLARWIGEAADMPLAAKPDMEAISLGPATLERQLAHHPQIVVLDRQEELARAELRLTEANKKSDWTVEVAYAQRGPAYSDMVSIGVSIPLQWDQKNRQDRELSARLALLGQAQVERRELLRSHGAEVRVMINEWENQRERHARYQRELIPLANDRTRAAVAAYRGGKSGLADVLAARRNEIDMRIQALQRETEAARLWARINFLLPVSSAASHSTLSAREAK
ncbi:MAG: TolC family protein [Pseudomonadota bacterium]